jgi:trimeric autotransporter adhesin
MKRAPRWCTAFAILATATTTILAGTATPGHAHTVAGTLPAGTSITVSIDTPTDGQVLPAGPVAVTGTATVGQGVQDDISLLTVLDLSSSTQAGGACGGNPNNDAFTNSTLDCEIEAAKQLNLAAIDLTTVSEVGAAVFANTGATADVRPPGNAVELITQPDADLNTNGALDMDEVFNSATTTNLGQFTARPLNDGTSFVAGINALAGVANAATRPRVVVAFLSDGMGDGASTDAALDALLAQSPNVTIFTFAIGTNSTCGAANNAATLAHIADRTGGECELVQDVSTLPDILPGVIASQLTSLTMTVDGSPSPIGTITPALPEDGPATVTYAATTAALSAGTHEICVTAAGTDRGGPGSVQDCHDIVINAPPVVDAGGPYAGQEGTPVTIAGSVTDPDSAETFQWSVGPGGDPGTTCAFNPTQLTTTVTCTDDGVFTLTLTANDGVNPPVSQSTTLTLTNVAPAVTISAPANGALFPAGTPVTFTAPFTDIGTNDTHTCTVDFDDGTAVAAGTVAESPGSGTCTATHAFASTALGPHDVLVRVTDDDGGSATAVVRIVIFLPAEAFAIQATGLVTIPKTPHATCPPDETLTQVGLNVPGVANLGVLNASCTINPATGTTTATASVDSASLLGGAITITNISSTCVSGPDGITRSSTVGTINGVPIGIGPGSINIPLVATVRFNETATVNGKLVQNAIRVTTLLGTQEIILASCRLG